MYHYTLADREGEAMVITFADWLPEVEVETVGGTLT